MDKKEMDKNCCICLDKIIFENYKNISTTECNHSFHTSCLLQCKSDKCPMCRKSMYAKEEMSEPIVDLNQTFVQQFEQQLTQIPIHVRPSLVDAYLNEVRKIKMYINFCMHGVLRIFVVFVLIFCLNILTKIMLILPQEVYNNIFK
jgi:hypothetical protein